MLQDEKDKPFTVDGAAAGLGITPEEYTGRVLEEQSARLGGGVSSHELMMRISQIHLMERAMGK